MAREIDVIIKWIATVEINAKTQKDACALNHKYPFCYT